MYISKVHVTSFKSYHQSGEVEFKPGFNVVVGQNSAGKTALLEAMQLQFAGNPHRSLKTVPAPGDSIALGCSVRVTFVLTRDELLHMLKNTHYHYALPRADFRFPGSGNFIQNADGFRAFLGWLFSQLEFRVTVECRANGQLVPVEDRFGLYPAGPLENDRQSFVSARVNTNGLPEYVSFESASPNHDVTAHLASRLRPRVYRFLAERFNFGDSPVGTNRVLKPNAENLPEVLDLLNDNPARMERFIQVVRKILPQVQHVSVTKIFPNSNQIRAQILVWPHVYTTERRDLAIPLNECGSGIGQVLAMLYVVMNSDEPEVILVDEPQSFLHPGAVRKLIEVLKGIPQHQYIISTHSPAVISAADPATLTIVSAVDGESKLEMVDPRSTKHARVLLAELGARLSDVFGADDIIWVEGQTEEECFPMILRQVAKRSLMGTAIVGIKRTGDLQGRDKRKWMEMHRKLSDANALVPPTIAFAFDGECLTEPQKEELRKLAPGRVHFLPRRMYENYLLDPDAITSVANAIPGFRDQPLSADEVQQWLGKKREERRGKDAGSKQLRYFCDGITAVPVEWERTVDAASLLKDLFRELSETCVSFEKTTHSVDITEWLIEHKPEALKEVADFVASLLGTKPDSMVASA